LLERDVDSSLETAPCKHVLRNSPGKAQSSTRRFFSKHKMAEKCTTVGKEEIKLSLPKNKKC
jgi:hypothetical protein